MKKKAEAAPRRKKGSGVRWQTVFPPDVYDLLTRLAALDSVNESAAVRMAIIERAERRGVERLGFEGEKR